MTETVKPALEAVISRCTTVGDQVSSDDVFSSEQKRERKRSESLSCATAHVVEYVQRLAEITDCP